MYFSENLETCTIGWVSFCEGGVGLFYFFGCDGTDRAGLVGGYIPRRCTPAHSSTPGRTAHDRQQGRPRGDDWDGGGAGMHSARMLRVQRFYMLVRLILNILLTCTFNHV